MRSFYEIKELLKSIVKEPRDAFFAEDLGFSYGTFRNRVTRNSIPLKEVLDFCKSRGIDAMKILYKDAKVAKDV